ncbi:MAG: MFS transporter [Betaproteobacteria bacterium]|nr:MFS transporter [Betaproteobacteria bacterium]
MHGLPNDPLPPAFHKLAISNLMAQSAEQLTLAAVPIVAVLMLQAGPGQIGVIAAVQSLPFLLLSMPLGLLADRMSRKKLMLLSEMLRVGALMVLIAGLLLDLISVPLLAVAGFFAAVGTVGFSVSAPSLVPALVNRAHLAKANGREDREEAAQLVSSAFFLMVVAASLLGCLGWFIGSWISWPELFQIRTTEAMAEVTPTLAAFLFF